MQFIRIRIPEPLKPSNPQGLANGKGFDCLLFLEKNSSSLEEARRESAETGLRSVQRDAKIVHKAGVGCMTHPKALTHI